jgi:hypothetical protein
MNSQKRSALTLVLGVSALPAVAQPTRASEAASSASAPQENANPQGGVEWFVAGVAVGIVLTVAWIKIRGSDKGGGTAALA